MDELASRHGRNGRVLINGPIRGNNDIYYDGCIGFLLERPWEGG